MICENISRDSKGNLTFAGASLTELAERYGTPLYLYDEARVRERCRTYLKAVRDGFGDNARVLYASKAASFKRLYEIMKEEGMGIDVVSMGEIRTATLAGYPLENAYFHSNNKTDTDINYAMDRGVGHFVVDNAEELYRLDYFAAKRGIKQKILLRITPGIDPHTYAAVATGKVDSKFGSAIETGQASEMVDIALSLPSLELCGFHCHVGSQIFDAEVYLMTARVMLEFVKATRDRCGFVCRELDLGGGLGVRYIESQPTLDISATILSVAEAMKKMLGINPAIHLVAPKSITRSEGKAVRVIDKRKLYG
jgi:diaminopimelate decarboxylase